MKFFQPDEYKVTMSGAGYTVGELTSERSKSLDYVRKTCLVAHFDGLQTLLEFLPDKMPYKGAGGFDSSVTGSGSGWAEFGYDEALKIFTNNPSKVRDFTEKDTALIGGDVNGLALEYDMTGDMLDVGRYLDGEPEVFASLTDGKPRGKRINMLVNIVHSSGTSKTFINDRNKRIARLVDWLEAQQVRVQLTYVMSSFNAHVEVEAKLYHEPLDINTVAVLGHSDFFRRMGFRLTEYSKTISHGYGNAGEFQSELSRRPELLDDAENNELGLIVGNIHRDVNAEFDTLEKTLEQVLAGEIEAKKLGVLA